MMISPVLFWGFFLSNKSKNISAVEKFITDSATYKRVKSLKSQNGSEFISTVFQILLDNNKIRYETSASYSPYQNEMAERNWCMRFKRDRCNKILNFQESTTILNACTKSLETY